MGKKHFNKEREESSIKESLLNINRVVKVVKGGRKFAFAALVVAGDMNGRVGCGRRKAKEVPDAREKASRVARKDLETRKIPLYQDRTIHHDVSARSGASKVILKRTRPGTGIIAGGAMRTVLELVGIKDIVAKSIGSSNIYTVIDATLSALAKLSTPKSVAERRGKRIGELSVSAPRQRKEPDASEE